MVSRNNRIPACIFAKPPVPAQVKTRLIPALGAEGAAALAHAMFLDVWRTVESFSRVRPILATTSSGGFPVSVSPDDIWLQGDGDLGQRIERILTRGLLHAPAAIAIGADSPALTAAHLTAALDALRTSDAVVGPSTDGGFYLLALRKCQPGLLSSLPWSVPETKQALKHRMKSHGLAVFELEPLFDVDIPADLTILVQHLQAHPSSAPSTRAWYSQQCESASLSPR
jgi:rSAM/selenodomain-associated transferase 1